MVTSEQIQKILKWAWEDPANRVSDAQDRVNELARAETDPQVLAEIQDAGVMLSRLAGTLVHTGGILDQLQGQG